VKYLRVIEKTQDEQKLLLVKNIVGENKREKTSELNQQKVNKNALMIIFLYDTHFSLRFKVLITVINCLSSLSLKRRSSISRS